ncbi:hypothetical protein DPMN_110600 [Dreissena polymorpha]|uniref:Uncharacterized protein n=1 Tax=Dreissena polymorpha TaxID=45954 RepID=A0A9D4KCZ0_DREPO|nr:hypothetical protein DPMN_110600 [Dreissena polymorpha]
MPARPPLQYASPGYSCRSHALHEDQSSVQASRARLPGPRDEARKTTPTRPVYITFIYLCPN